MVEEGFEGLLLCAAENHVVAVQCFTVCGELPAGVRVTCGDHGSGAAPSLFF